MVERTVSNLRELGKRWMTHNNSRSAAAIAYYAIFTLAPILVFVTAIAGVFVQEEQAQQMIRQFLTDSLGTAGTDVATDIFTNAHFTGHGTSTVYISIAVLLYGASSSFSELRSAFDQIFDHETQSRREAVLRWLLGRILAALSVLIGGILLIAAVVGSNLLHEYTSYSNANSGPEQALVVALMLAVFFSLFVVIYRWLPGKRPHFQQVWLGAAIASILFELGQWVFGFYIARSAIASAYGPGGCIVAFIAWVYYSAQIVLLGAEVCALQARK